MYKRLCISAVLGFTTIFQALPAGLNPNVPEKALQAFEKKMELIRAKPAFGRAIKIQDLVDVIGEEKVKLNGFGVVTGLNGTGDSGEAAIKMLINVAEKIGIRLDLADIKKKNVALVSISSEVGPHQRNFDVAVKSIGDAKSLQNGSLEGSSLHPIGNPDVYAVASGTIALGARYYEATGAAGTTAGSASVTIGHPTAGFIINGGQLIKKIPSFRQENNQITLFLKHANNRTVTNVANIINEYMNEIQVEAIPTNASTITVNLKNDDYLQDGLLTRLIADIGELPVEVSRKAIISIDQGTGVIAMTEGVKMEPGSIAISGLTVTVSSDITPVTRQGLTDGETSFIDVPDLQVSEDQANFLTVPAGTDLRKVQETLNALRLTPTSIISVFSAMHKAGMIHADIVVIPDS